MLSVFLLDLHQINMLYTSTSTWNLHYCCCCCCCCCYYYYY